jgi:hypothetical protein
MVFPTIRCRLYRRSTRVLLALIAIAFTAAVAAAQPQPPTYRGTPEDQRACSDDVFRLCGQFIPDAPRIVQCLIVNKPNLSPACHEVFSRNDPKPPPRRRRRRE